MEWGTDMVLQRLSKHPEAVAQFEEICVAHPDEGLNILIAMLEIEHNDDVMTHAGVALTNLLEYGGDSVLSRVEADVEDHPRLLELLSWCYPSDPKSTTWLRVRRFAPDVPW